MALSLQTRSPLVEIDPREVARMFERIRGDDYILPPMPAIRWEREQRAPLQAAAPTHVRSSTGSATGSSTAISIQSDGSDRLLIAFVANTGSSTPTGMTYNAVSGTRYNPGGFPADNATFIDTTGRFTIWYLIAPAVTTTNVVVSWGGSVDYDVAVSLFNGAHQTTPLVNGLISANLAGAEVTSVSLSPTTTTDHLAIGAIAIGNFGTTTTSGGGQSRLASIGWTRVDSEAGASGTTTLSFTWSGAEPATLIAFAIASSTASSGPSLVTLSPADGSQNVVPTQTLQLTFDEAVQAVSGNITVTETGVGTIEVISVTDPRVVFSSTTVTITLLQPLARDKAYDVQIASGAIEASGDSEDWAGITTATGWNFDTFRSSFQTVGVAAYSAASGSSVTPAYPTGIAAGDLLVLLVGQKPSAANGGTCTTPTNWDRQNEITGATDGDTGGYTTTLAADTGNCNYFTFTKVATGSESGTLSVTVGTNSVTWAAMLRYSKASDCTWSVAGTTGKDTSAGNVSIAGAADPGVRQYDHVVAGMVIPTDVTTPGQFSAEAITQTGVTFGTITEVEEPDSGNGNDIGGFIVRADATAGTSSAAPTWTATAGGTTTNVRGPGAFLRLRALLPPMHPLMSSGARQLHHNAVYRM